ncbi:hypothetical protein GGI20_006282, partial [Coemansia sp. BCRC 34301]
CVPIDDPTAWDLVCLVMRFLESETMAPHVIDLLRDMTPVYGDKIWLILAKLSAVVSSNCPTPDDIPNLGIPAGIKIQAMVELSTGEITRFSNIERSITVTSPVVLQIVSYIQVLNNQASAAPSGYRCMMSDGERMSLAVIPNKLASLIADETIARFTVLRITKCNVSKKARANESPVLFILIQEAEVIETLSEKI